MVRRWLPLLLLPAALASAAPASAATPPQARIGEREAIAIADADPKVRSQRAEHPDISPAAVLENGNWKVDYFSGDRDLAQVIVDDETGVVRESWTGYQVAWKMARGYEGAFGRKLNAPYVWIPLCAIFLIGLVDWRRPLRLAHLDLLVLLSFGISHLFFNRAEIGLSVPLAYPPLLYLLARLLWLGFRGGGSGLRPVWPAAWLLIAALFLIGFRGGLNIADSNVIDVGYSGVIGADLVAHGDNPYGNFPADNPSGDTYGPVNYYAYVPFELALPWSGSWDDLPAAHAAAIFFDLVAVAGLVLLGRRLREGAEGRVLGAALAFGWAAYPYTAFALESNANDAVVGALLVLTVLVAARPAARGALLALASLTKFAAAPLLPLMATYSASRRSIATFLAAFAAVALLAMAPVIIGPGLDTFWDRTIGFQAGRDSPFSIWGQAPSLEPLQTALKIGIAGLAALVAFVPARKSPVQLAALAAALLIGVQLTVEHWFYLYIPWFFPLALVALLAIRPRESSPALWIPPGHRGESPRSPPLPRRLRRRYRSARASA
jgi:hypothetical protein